jgi:hypothetical protein
VENEQPECIAILQWFVGEALCQTAVDDCFHDENLMRQSSISRRGAANAYLGPLQILGTAGIRPVFFWSQHIRDFLRRPCLLHNGLHLFHLNTLPDHGTSSLAFLTEFGISLSSSELERLV